MDIAKFSKLINYSEGVDLLIFLGAIRKESLRTIDVVYTREHADVFYEIGNEIIAVSDYDDVAIPSIFGWNRMALLTISAIEYLGLELVDFPIRYRSFYMNLSKNIQDRARKMYGSRLPNAFDATKEFATCPITNNRFEKEALLDLCVFKFLYDKDKSRFLPTFLVATEKYFKNREFTFVTIDSTALDALIDSREGDDKEERLGYFIKKLAEEVVIKKGVKLYKE